MLLKMSTFQQKIMRYPKKQVSMAHTLQKKAGKRI